MDEIKNYKVIIRQTAVSSEEELADEIAAAVRQSFETHPEQHRMNFAGFHLIFLNSYDLFGQGQPCYDARTVLNFADFPDPGSRRLKTFRRIEAITHVFNGAYEGDDPGVGMFRKMIPEWQPA